MPFASLRRAWAAPIAVHLAALVLVLVAGAAFVGTHASLSEDEGAAIVQARQLSEQGSWIRAHPYPELDHEGRNYPYELSERGTKGIAPYAKHPLYALVLGALWRMGGINALVGLSIVGTLGSAWVASRFARRIDAGLERPAVWAIGLGSPLLFDSYLVIAHAIAAAIAGALLLVVTRERLRAWPVEIAASAALSATLVLLRTEGVLLVAAAAVVLVLTRRSRWLGLATGVAGVLAYLAEKSWVESIVGSPVHMNLTAPEIARESARSLGGGGLAGRIDGAWVTLFSAEYGESPGGALLLLALVGLAAAVVLARINARVATVCGILAAACAVLRLFVEPSSIVPGLFVATPIVWAGMWAAAAAHGQKRLRLDGRLLAVAGIFVIAVLATQYSRGGGVEWGGRFFALMLPAVIPLALAGLRTQPTTVVRCVVAATAALSILAVREVRTIHCRTDQLLAAVEIPPGAVPITIAGAVPRLDWRRYDERQWLLVAESETAELLARLEASGVSRAILLFPRGQRPAGVSGAAAAIGQTRWRTIDIVFD